MALAGDIRAGGAYVEVTCEGSKLEAGLKDAESATQKFQRKLDGWSVAVGAAVTAAFVGASKAVGSFFSSLVDKGDALDKMSQRIGISVEGIGKLSQMAQLCGSSMETFEGAISKMQKSLEAAAQGGEAQQQAFQRLGLSITDLKAMAPEDQFLAVSKAMGGLTDQSERTALAMQLFGKSGTELMPFFNQGEEGISAMEQKISELGGVMSEKGTKAMAELKDAMTLLKNGIAGTAANLMANLAPALTKAIEMVSSAFAATKKFLTAHPGIRALIGTVAGAVGTFTAAAGAMTAWSLAAGKLAGAIKLVTGAMKMLTPSNPWILAIVGAGAAVGGLIAWLNKGEKAVTEFSHKCEEQTRTHQEQADANNALMQRLEELNNKQNKNAEEMAEAEAICGRLNSAYGDLGLSVDKATGSIVGLTEAQKKMRQAQMATKIADTKKEIAEIQSNITSSQGEHTRLSNIITDEISDLIQKDPSIARKPGEAHAQLYGKNKKYTEAYDARAAIDAQNEQLEAKKQYLAELEKGVDLESTSTPSAPAPAPEPAAPAEKVDTADSERSRLEGVRNQASRIGVSDYDLALRDAAAALDKTRADAEKVKQSDIAGGMSQEEAEARFRETMEAAQQIYADAVHEANEKRAAEEKRLAEEREKEAQEAADEIERARKEREKAQEEEMRKIAERQRKEQEYQKEYSKILSQNINDGIRESASARGTFSAFEGSRGDPIQQKMLKANEQIEKFTKKMYEELIQLNEKYAASGYTA